MTMTDDQQVLLTAAVVDDRGNPVAPGSLQSPDWVCDNPNVLTLTPSADGSTCTAAAAGALGTGNVSFSTTLPNGATVGSTAFPITVVSGAASTVDISAGTPVPIVPVSPPAPPAPPAPANLKP